MKTGCYEQTITYFYFVDRIVQDKMVVWRACILTMSHWSSGLPVCFLSQGTQVQIPRGVPMWNQDSPVGIVSLHWWPQRDWSFLWPRLRRASSRTITRPSCQQCDNPTWSHTAFLSRFHACCRSPFRLHNRWSRLLGGNPVESLHSHHVSLVQWTTCLLPITRDTGSNPQGGVFRQCSMLVKKKLSCLASWSSYWSN
jgi:hypothetical protein